MRLATTFLLLALPSAQALESVDVTFYEEGLTNTTVRRSETFITDGQGFYRVDIDVEEAPVYNLATNYVASIEHGGNLFDTFSKYNPTLFVRNTNYTGFTCQSIYDNQALAADGWGRNGTLVSPTEVLYVRHYYADNPGRAVAFCNEEGELSWGYPRWSAKHTAVSKDLCLVKLDRPIDDSIKPAKLFTQAELNLFPYGFPLVGVDRHHTVRVHFAHYQTIYNFDNQIQRYVDGDSGVPLFVKTEKAIYVVGKVRTPTGFHYVTQEDIDLMRELF